MSSNAMYVKYAGDGSLILGGGSSIALISSLIRGRPREEIEKLITLTGVLIGSGFILQGTSLHLEKTDKDDKRGDQGSGKICIGLGFYGVPIVLKNADMQEAGGYVFLTSFFFTLLSFGGGIYFLRV
jgi:hypothetical protein